MPRSASLTGLSLAALIALTACSPSTDADGTPASAPATASSAPTASAQPSTQPSTQPSGDASTGASDDASAAAAEGTGTYSSVELSAILGAVPQADGTPLQIIPTAQIEQSMDQARRFLEGVTVTPEECAIFVSNSLEAPEGAGVATGVSSADGDAVQTIVSVASAQEIASSGEEEAARTAEALESCTSISIEAQGVSIDQSVEALDATTAADRTVGTLALQTSADGAKQQTMTLVGTRGDLAVTAVRTAQDTLPEGTQEDLQGLIDSTLSAAEQG